VYTIHVCIYTYIYVCIDTYIYIYISAYTYSLLHLEFQFSLILQSQSNLVSFQRNAAKETKSTRWSIEFWDWRNETPNAIGCTYIHIYLCVYTYICVYVIMLTGAFKKQKFVHWTNVFTNFIFIHTYTHFNAFVYVYKQVQAIYHLCHVDNDEPDDAEQVVVSYTKGLKNGQEERNCGQKRQNSSYWPDTWRSDRPIVTSPLPLVASVSHPVKRTTTQEVEGHDKRHEAYGFWAVSFRNENFVPWVLELHTHTKYKQKKMHAYAYMHAYIHTHSVRLDDFGAQAHIKTIWGACLVGWSNVMTGAKVVERSSRVLCCNASRCMWLALPPVSRCLGRSASERFRYLSAPGLRGSAGQRCVWIVCWGAHLRSRSFHYHNHLFPPLVVVL